MHLPWKKDKPFSRYCRNITLKLNWTAYIIHRAVLDRLLMWFYLFFFRQSQDPESNLSHTLLYQKYNKISGDYVPSIRSSITLIFLPVFKYLLSMLRYFTYITFTSFLGKFWNHDHGFLSLAYGVMWKVNNRAAINYCLQISHAMLSVSYIKPRKQKTSRRHMYSRERILPKI